MNFEITEKAMVRCHGVIEKMLQPCNDERGHKSGCDHTEAMMEYIEELGDTGPEEVIQHFLILQSTIVKIVQAAAGSMNDSPTKLWERISFTMQASQGLAQLDLIEGGDT